MNKRLKRRISSIMFEFPTIFFLLIAVFPFYWMIYTALLPSDAVYTTVPKLIPPGLALDHLVDVFNGRPILQWIGNSLIVAVLSILFSVPPSILAGYGFYRYARFRLKSALFRFLFLVLAVPPTIVIVPYFLLLSSWGLLDSLVGLAITYVAFLIPIQTILYYSYLFSIPRQIEEAAIIDGASKLEILGTITLPLSLPAVLAISVYAFVLAWNEFAFAVTLLRSPSNWTSVLGLYSFIGEWNLDWNGAMVTALYITIPALIFFFVTQKYYIRGMTAGAVKGG